METIRSEKAIWLLIITVEVVYVILTRITLIHYWTYSLDAELIRTPLRVIVVLIYWIFLHQWFSSRELAADEVLNLHLLLSLVLFLSVPILVGDLSYMTPYTRAIYAVTSIFVSLKEEITFRALIQTLLTGRLGHLKAIFVSTVLFTGYHIGAIPLSVFAYGQVVVVSLFLGVLYARFQNLWLAISLHAAYDALWSLTPIGTGQLFPYTVGLVVLIASLILLVKWNHFRFDIKTNLF